MVTLAPRGGAKGRALVLYGTRIFERMLAGEDIRNSHPAALHNLCVTQTLSEMGFSVDVVWYDNPKFRPAGHYDLVLDAGGGLQRISGALPGDCVRVFDPNFAHWTSHNQRNYARHEQLLQRRKRCVLPGRLLTPCRSEEEAHWVFFRGGPYAAGTFAHVAERIRPLPQMLGPLPEALPRDMEGVRRTFLWLSGTGLVHKGLDLALEAFCLRPDYRLVIFGNIEKEKPFVELYRKELFEMPNVEVRGWTDTTSPAFSAAAAGAVAIVNPSASEFSCTSLLTAMATGLIPVATASSDVAFGDAGIVIEDESAEGIAGALDRVAATGSGDLRAMSLQAREVVTRGFGARRFKQAFARQIADLFDLPLPAACRVQRNGEEWDPAVSGLQVGKAPPG